VRLQKTLVGLGVSFLSTLSLGAEAAPPDAAPPAVAAPADGAPASVKLSDGAPAPSAPAGGTSHTLQLRSLEERLSELAEKLRRHQATLARLSDGIMEGGGGEARVSVKLTSSLSGAFRVTRVLVLLDGVVQKNQADPTGTQAERFEMPVFNGLVPAGDHTVQVQVNVQGHGYGVFSYMRGYRFEVRSAHSFTAVEGKTVQLEALAFEKGTSITPIEERPSLRYGEKIVDGLGEAVAKPAQGGGASPQR
jgi:hypothetical protein